MTPIRTARCAASRTVTRRGDPTGTPTFDLCPCCGSERGYADATPAAARRYRAAWIAAGAYWAEPEFRPADWSLEEQLRHVPPGF